jgi:hypothetical protein
MVSGVEPTSRSFTNTRAPEGRDSTDSLPAAPVPLDPLDPLGDIAGVTALSEISRDSLGRRAVSRTRRSAAAKPFRAT